jgi:uncharacterized protein (DUF488 family)
MMLVPRYGHKYYAMCYEIWTPGPLDVRDLFTLTYDKIVICIEPVSCPNEAKALTEYTEVGMSMEDIVEHH